MSKARDLANAGTALTTVSATELGYLDGVTSAVQTQIDSKIGSASAINPTIVDAKGDLIAATASDTVARLAVGANDTVLTADSSTATGLKWATPAAGGMTLLSTTTLSGTTTSVTGVSGSYTQLFVRILNPVFNTGGAQIYLGFNSTTSTFWYNNFQSSGTALAANTTTTWITNGFNQDNTGGGMIYSCLIDAYATSNRKCFNYYGIGISAGSYRSFGGSGGFGSSTAISSVQISNSGPYSFTGGTIEIYGVK
jgi:hypothetical protein